MAEDKATTESDKNESSVAAQKKPKGIVSRIWNSIFRLSRDDFEQRLQNISKEEAAVLARMKRRSITWRKMARHLIVFSVIFEVIAVGYAIMTTRSMDMDWKMRAFRVLPMFLLPALSSAAYSAFVSFTRMCERKDQKILERLRAERQAKINELKEKTNYYTTQQLIQRYDPDPAAKAAAATVLASKLGLDSGLKVYLENEADVGYPTGRSDDVDVMKGSGLRHRKQAHSRSSSAGIRTIEETLDSAERDGLQTSEHNQLVVEHGNPRASTVNDGGWIARLAAMLVGEDPTQSYALICGSCHMHNGLVRKEDFPFITYYCPHCRALNQPKQSTDTLSSHVHNHAEQPESLAFNQEKQAEDPVVPSKSPSLREGNIEAIDKSGDSSDEDKSSSNAELEIKEVSEKQAMEKPSSPSVDEMK